MKNSRTRDLVMYALLIALVFIATRFINLRLPVSINGGLIHLGTAMLYIAAIVFGKKHGAIAGAFGMGLFDITSGWLSWAPFTFVVRGAMGYLVGHISFMNNKRGSNVIYNLIAMITGGILMIIGYYFTEVILYANWVSPFTSILGNAIQVISGVIIALPLSAALKKTHRFD